MPLQRLDIQGLLIVQQLEGIETQVSYLVVPIQLDLSKHLGTVHPVIKNVSAMQAK